MRIWIIGVAAVLAAAGPAAAQAPFESRPIDTSRFVVGPANTAANVTGAATAGTIRTFGRAIADTIESNGIVRTVNNLFGRRMQPTPNQPGFSALPQPGSYLSTRYPNSFTPVRPLAGTFGRTPTNIPLPTGPTTTR